LYFIPEPGLDDDVPLDIPDLPDMPDCGRDDDDGGRESELFAALREKASWFGGRDHGGCRNLLSPRRLPSVALEVDPVALPTESADALDIELRGRTIPLPVPSLLLRNPPYMYVVAVLAADPGRDEAVL
tara:strand:+ start:545 stop:931 length:387 start_codon:yes stop_codon:yes gene_type:complete